jgi:2-oxoisovalerate dehydrogenase E1 component alpha subunit
MTTVASFEIPYTTFIAPDGSVETSLPDFARDPAAVIPLYRAMVRTRTLDARAVALHRTGRLGTYPSSLGQEAVGVGTAAAMEPGDVLVPSYRDVAAQLWRGVTPQEILLYWAGDERGSDYAGPRQDFPMSITVGEHPPQAAGVALAMQIRREPRVAVCMFGDGATSKGSFYEAMNAAGAMSLPVVFVAVNNGWAISAPRAIQSAAPTLAQKAVAAGFPGEQVDGNDVVAMTHVCSRAVERARTGDGPTLIEAVTYRLGDHTTVDDARRYREDAEVSRHWELEPLTRIRAFLVAAGVWAKEDEEGLLAECAAEIDRAAEEYLATGPPTTDAMFDYLYAELPPGVEAQRLQAALDAASDA